MLNKLANIAVFIFAFLLIIPYAITWMFGCPDVSIYVNCSPLVNRIAFSAMVAGIIGLAVWVGRR